LNARLPTSHRVSPPSKVFLEPAPSDVSRRGPLPWAFVPDDTCGMRDTVFAGFSCPPPSVRRVWSPSQRLAPSHTSPALFHAGSVPGVLPSEHTTDVGCPAFPPRRAPRAVTAGFASMNDEVHRSWSLQTGFRVLPASAVTRTRQGFIPARRGPAPMGFVPFKGLLRSPCRALPPGSFHALADAMGSPLAFSCAPKCRSATESSDAKGQDWPDALPRVFSPQRP
jgi:hypothetical protein